MQFAIPATAPAPLRSRALQTASGESNAMPGDATAVVRARRGRAGDVRAVTVVVAAAAADEGRVGQQRQRDEPEHVDAERLHPRAVDDLPAEILVRCQHPGVDDADLHAVRAPRGSRRTGGVPALRRVDVGVGRPAALPAVVQPVQLAEARVIGNRRRARDVVRLGVEHPARAVQPRRRLGRIARDAHDRAPTPRTAPSVSTTPATPRASDRCSGEARSGT